MRYGDEGGKTSVTMPANPMAKRKPKASKPDAVWPTKANGRPDFTAMTPGQRLAYHSQRLGR